MKFNKKNLGSFFLILFAGILIGSLFWEIFERILHNFGVEWSLTTRNPIQLFDVYVISFSLRVNPGSIIGGIAGVVFFKAI
jgi:hypothetical protein